MIRFTRSLMKLFRFTSVLLLPLLWSATAQAWWNKEWAIRRQITIDTSSKEAGLSGPVGSPVVLLRLHDGNFQFGNASEDGSDIRPIAQDDKTPLSFHIEKYDSLLSEAYIWVRVPDVKEGAPVSFWLYYGRKAGSAERVESSKDTYHGEQSLVFHFGEQGTAPSDAAGNGNNGDKAASNSAGSMIGGGLKLAGVTAFGVPASESLEWREGGTLTWSAWIKPASHAPNAVLFSRRDGANALVVGLDNGAPYAEVSSGGNSQRVPGVTPVGVNSWHHLAVVADAGKLSVYVDGESVASMAASLPALKSALYVGGDSPEKSGATGFTGELDELQISPLAGTPAAIKFAALSQGGGDKAAMVLSMGEDEAPKGLFDFMEGGYIGVIIGSLTVDGWVVIGLLAVMFVISWGVMIGKAGYLNKIAKANGLFIEEWQHVAKDFSILDQGDADHARRIGGRVDSDKHAAIQNSTVYRIYEIGMSEVRNRMATEKGSGGKRFLSARAMSAIRASLEDGFLKEMNRLNNKMVLLTIAISGGPFLGLLGTVVGVMITFAAVAQAGDVNVNAIAPGIAAALAATVAGLGVAIPALFGYNYLLARVKEASASMQTFIEEFTTKAGEFYDNANQ